jgi:hypothetical protein
LEPTDCLERKCPTRGLADGAVAAIVADVGMMVAVAVASIVR